MPTTESASGEAAAAGRTVHEPGNGTLDLFPLDTSEPTLLALLKDLFQQRWADIRFGTLIQGAVFEIRAPSPPARVAMLDGYLTVDFGHWHLHICIGEHKGSARNPVAPELARHRRTSRAELYRRLGPDGNPVSWGLRLFNGKDEQQLTVFLPNPFLDDDDHNLSPPDWTRLALWDELRLRFLHLPPHAKDRQATRFVHD